MNKLEEQLGIILEKALNVAEKTGEFVMEQAPQLLQEFYMWHTLRFSLGILLAVIFLLLSRFTCHLGSEKYDGKGLDYDEILLFGRKGHFVMMIIPFVIFSVAGVAFLFTNIYNIVYISVAPRLFLIEFFIK